MLRMAVPRKFFCEELDPEVASAFEQALSVLSTMSDISEINLEVPIDRTLQKAESYAYHCEFVRQSPELYQPETLRRIRTGEGISPEDAARCKRELQEARKQIASVFNRSEEHTSELQSPCNLVCRLLLEKKKSAT